MVVGRVRGRSYAFIGLERIGGIMVYEVTIPRQPRFVQSINTRRAKSQAPEKNRAALELFMAPFDVLPFSEAAALVYGDIRADLEERGTPIGPMDLMIAAHALAVGATLVSNNLREFRRVPGLATENWTRS